jgi:cytoskeletal protein RodZ
MATTHARGPATTEAAVNSPTKGVRIHETLNRTLATIALVLSIIVLAGLIWFGLRVGLALNQVGNALDDVGAAAASTSPTQDPSASVLEPTEEELQAEAEANDDIPDAPPATPAEFAAAASLRVVNGDDPDAVYDDALRTINPKPLEEDPTVRRETAANICTALDSGQTPGEVTTDLAAASRGAAGAAEIQLIVGAAVGAYCSQHMLEL